jgi:UPF0755 protein
MKKTTFIILLFAFLIFGSFLWWKNGLSPVDSINKKNVSFVIQKGSGLKEITSELKAAGLIKSRVVFFLYTRLNKFENKIQAGNFTLSPSMTAQEIAQNLTHGRMSPNNILFREGIRATEIAEILKRNIPTYNSSWENILISNEGYLFPSTYDMPKDTDIETVVSLMKNKFEQEYKKLDTSKTKLSKNEIVTLASLVEREAKSAEDRPLVAAVLLNRLEIGMKLELCATVQYALGYSQEQKTWWKNGITFEDIKISSPYNTYKNAGLPPTPIANPGIEALEAVINPTKTDYLYWISDKSGHLHFAKTLQAHNANIKKYGL